MSCCFGPYNITCLDLASEDNLVFVDPKKTRRVAVISSSSNVALPSEDAVLVHQEEYLDNDITISWYECSSLGRSYYIFPTACEVIVTSFEDGLAQKKGFKATEYGSESFCFGKTLLLQDSLTQKTSVLRLLSLMATHL